MKVYLFSLVLSLLSSVAIVGMTAPKSASPEQQLQQQQACADSLFKTITANFAATH